MAGTGKIGRPASPLREAKASDFALLQQWQTGLSSELSRRASVILFLLEGASCSLTSKETGVPLNTVYRWRSSWNEAGCEGLETRSHRCNRESSHIKVSLRRKIEQIKDPDIGTKELKGLALQFIRDMPRDDVHGTSNAFSKMKLDGLRLLKDIIKLEQADGKKRLTLDDIFKEAEQG